MIYQVSRNPAFAVLTYIDKDDSSYFSNNTFSLGKDEWKVVPLTKFVGEGNEYLPIADFHSVAGVNTVFSERAVVALDSFLEPAGELLEVDVEQAEQRYFHFICTNAIDCLDKQKSAGILEHPEFDNQYLTVSKPVINHKKVAADVFKILQLPRRLTFYVSDAFVDAVQTSGLTGFAFYGGSFFDSDPILT